MVSCSKCGQEVLPEKLMAIETDANTYYYCTACITQAQASLAMKIYLNKDERKLLKGMRKFLKHEKN